MRARQWWSCLLAYLLGFLVTQLAWIPAAEGASSEHSLVVLEWTSGPGAESCPKARELIEDVELSLGRRAFTDQAHADRVLRVAIRHETAAPRWRSEITLSTPSGRYLGKRELAIDSETCNEASESLVLALALMIDLPEAAEEIEEKKRARDEGRRTKDTGWHLAGRLGPSAAVGPSLAGGVHASVAVTPRRFWPIVADGFLWVRGESGVAGRSFWLAHTMLGLGVCPLTIGGSKVAARVCVGPQAELVTGWGSGFAKDRGGLAATFGGLAQTGVTYLLGRGVHAFATLGVAATPQRIEFTYLDERGVERSLHRTALVKGVGAFGLAIDFF